MPVITRANMLADFEFPDEPARDFEVGGVPAQYASGHPKQWKGCGNELDFTTDAKETPDLCGSYYSAISPDHKLLAISTRNEKILIYDINTQDLRQVLDGTGPVEFRPEVDVEDRHVDPTVKRTSAHSRPAYTLFGSVPRTETMQRRIQPSQLILWELDQAGRNLFEEEPVDASTMATKAIKAITSELVANHEWTKDFINTSALHADFSKSLQRVAANHLRRHHVIFEHATLSSFGSSSCSHDGKLFIYHTSNDSTQHGTRAADKLPCVVVYDLEVAKELYRLSGHTDAIMWSGFSPDNSHIASVSWDGTLRMYSAQTGELEWATEDSSGQSWTGAFSADSKHIVWSSKNGQCVEVHRVDDGQKVATFQGEFKKWCRCITWHPSRNEVALCTGRQAFIWSPFEGSDGKVWQHFDIGISKGLFGSMVEVDSVVWLDDGRLLCLEISDGTKMIYDTQNNIKELFKRPKGVDAAYVGHSLYGPLQTRDQAEFYLSVDGDGKARYWRNSVPSYPSWWDKEGTSPGPEKKLFPETGKYVKVTKAKPDAKAETRGQESWADKGAEIWTAQ